MSVTHSRKLARCCRLVYFRSHSTSTKPPIIRISNGTFYRHHPSSVTPGGSNQPLFSNLDFTLPSFADHKQHWAILGPSSSGKSTILQIFQGQHLCIPPSGRTYPYLSSEEIERKNPQLRIPSRAVKYVGFGGESNGISGNGTRGAYLSARYESRREDTDFSVMNYLQGKTQLNPAEEDNKESIDRTSLDKVIKDLRLADLLDMPVSNLSNGQTRRAKIARSLLGQPEVLLLDEPFMGLDPPTLITLSPLLHGLAKANAPRIILTLRSQDPIPDWITHLLYLKPECQIAYSGEKEKVLTSLRAEAGSYKTTRHGFAQQIFEIGRVLTAEGIIESSIDPGSQSDTAALPESRAANQRGQVDKLDTTPLVEMSGVRVAYGSKVVLGNWKQKVNDEARDGLWWSIRPGERWGIFGPNGSGKTTVLSLICSDHPQTYSLPILLFGRSRLPELGKPGISIFDIQAQIGHSSPEVHHHIPRSLTIRESLENAWAETFKSKPQLARDSPRIIDACLRWFEAELRPGSSANPKEAARDQSTAWANDYVFGELSFSAQRVLLFLRAVIKRPPLVILDESFSGMDDAVRDKCMLFLDFGETKTFARDLNANDSTVRRDVVDSNLSINGQVTIHVLGPEQALLCISHVREEVPDCVREWICLPEANTGLPARFGKLDAPLEGNHRGWNAIWDM